MQLFGYKNDLYFMPNPAAPKIERLTSTGAPEGIYNGVSDWIYEGMSLFFCTHGAVVEQRLSIESNCIGSDRIDRCRGDLANRRDGLVVAGRAVRGVRRRER